MCNACLNRSTTMKEAKTGMAFLLQHLEGDKGQVVCPGKVEIRGKKQWSLI